MQKFIFTVFILFGLSYQEIYSQPFQICSGAGQNSCTCATAPIICSINELDGYNFQMSTYQHPWDGPTPMCNPMPPGSGGTQSNNPTWVGFIAYCEGFTLEIVYNGCSGSGTARGLQAAIYSDCTNPEFNVVDGGCATDWDCTPPPCYGCGVTSGTRIMNISGLVIGQVYYLLVDGCGGSSCNVTINVLNTQGSCVQEIQPWPDGLNSIMGETDVCLGSTHSYSVNIPIGGVKFLWELGPYPGSLAYHDVSQIVPGNPEVSTSVTWNTVGTYQLCVDASNKCVPYANDPPKNCIIVHVHDAEAGNITAMPTPVCPNEIVNILVTGQNADPSISQYILIADASGMIVKVTQGTSDTFTWPECAMFTAYSYNYVTALGNIPAIGDDIASIIADCTALGVCCEIASAPFEFADNINPVIANPPANITVNCFIDIPPMVDLQYTDNCLSLGTVMGVQDDDYTNCDGGTITRTWTVTDECGNVDEKVQTITLLPVPEAVFTPFDDVTVSCANFPPATLMPQLAYNNGLTGSCAIVGVIDPIRTVDTMNCMGTVTYTWEKVDTCGRTIFDEQVYTIEPPLEATFVNPPADVTVSCNNFPLSTYLPPLQFTNGQTGVCQVMGQIIPTQMVDTVNCEGTVTFTWSGNDRCGRPLFHQQVWTIQPPMDIMFLNVPPDTATINCSQIPAANVLPPLMYSNNEPPGRCLIIGTVIPSRIDSYDKCGGQLEYLWEKTDSCGRSISYSQVLFINPAPEAVWINPPQDETLPCGQTVPAGYLPPLLYSNGAPTGSFCEIAGSAIPTRVDDIQECEGTTTLTWEITDDCGRPLAHSKVYTLSPPDLPTWINPPADMTVSCLNAPDPNILPPLSFNNGLTGAGCAISGTVNATRAGDLVDCAGTYVYTWTFTDQCNRTVTHTQNITILPPSPGAFINPPADMTVSCLNAPDPNVLPPLNYTNGVTDPTGTCQIMGSDIPDRTGTLVDCAGTYTYTWEFTDQCNRTVTHTQNITILPPPPGAFINPPADVTVSCLNAPDPNVLPPLNYTNGVTDPTGTCQIMGSDIPDRTGALVDCAGTYTYTWEFTDQCNRTVTHTQNITILPPPPGAFINPPADVTVSCLNAPDPTALPPLNYTNGVTDPSGACQIMGSDIPDRTGTLVDCAGTYTYTWEFTDQCNRTVTHTQNITILPPPPGAFINPPADVTVSCLNAPDPNVLPPLNYTNGVTDPSGACQIMGSATPTKTGDLVNCAGTYTYTWEFTDQCNRTVTHTQNITIQPPPPGVFINPPADVTVSCLNAPDPNVLPTLNYTNGVTDPSGACQIMGSATPTKTGDLVNCAGTYTYTWEFTDQCNRTVTHTQNITILPPAAPVFINPPTDVTLSCAQAPDLTNPPSLSYDNNDTGVCAISGSVTAMVSSNVNGCQATHILTWEFTDLCNRTIRWTQNITVQPPADASFVNPPPALINVTCENEPDPNDLLVLNVTNNSTGACLIEGTSTPTLNIVDNNCSKVYTYQWEFTDFCDRRITYTQVVNVAPPPLPTFVNPPTYTSMSCADAELFSAPDVSYSNNSACLIEGSLSPVVTKNFTACGGNIQISWTGNDACNRPLAYNQIIVVNPSPNPTITTPIPDDVTVSCQDLSVFAIPLDYSNGEQRPCNREGIIAPILNTSGVTLCGGTATVTWTNKDECNYTLTADQVITVLPAPQAAFINLPPSSIVIECTDVPPSPPTLEYTNGETGFCAIQGTVVAIVTGGFTSCGGTIQYTWQFTDQCGRSIVYNQNVTVLPAAEPFFTTEPDDVLLPCYQGFTPPPPLSYTNGLTGACAITGSVNAVTEDLGTTRIYTWTFKNPCTGNEISVNQEVSIRPVPNIVADPTNIDICYGEFYDLAEINVTDLNNTDITLTYHAGTPATPANELSQTLISTEAIATYYILATNEYGCTDEVKIQFHNLFGPQAGVGQIVSLCNDGRTLNLFNYLSPPYDNTGYWSDTYGTGLNITDPTMVSFAGQLAGPYPFDYIVPSTNLCPDAVATVQIDLVDPGNYEIKEITCSPDFMTYFVKIQVFGYSVSTSAGTMTTNGSIWTISNIPIAQNVKLTLKSNLGDCADMSIELTPPQCNCPVVPAPISGGNKEACQNQTGVSLSVSVNAGLTAQWYNAISGGTLLQDQSLTYLPPTNNTGLFTYYVQALDPLNGCYSVRIPITILVNPNPVAKDVTLSECDDNRDGISSFDLTKANSKLVSGGGYTFGYYLTFSDAQNGVNPLANPYTNTANNQIIFATVKDANGCIDIAEVTLHVLPIPDITFTVNHEKCFGNKDGIIFANPPFTNLEFKLNNLPWTTNSVFDSLASGAYTVQVRDELGCISSTSLTVNPGLRLTFSELTLSCDSKGTSSNANDDVYNIKINVSATPATTTKYLVTYLTKNLGSFDYNTSQNIQLPADGSSGLLIVTDEITGCTISRNIGPLTPCSTDCDITASNLMVDCNNNGTDADASDDIYTISFTASVVNGGSSTSFTLLVNNVIINTYPYGVPVSFTLPADGSTPDVKIRDLLNIQCITQLPVGNLSGCSGSCSISATITNVVCNDNGTINDPGDDKFSFTIRVTGFNVSDGWKVAGNNTIYAYNTNVVLGSYPISGGNLALNISDRIDTQCTKIINVTAPPPCSTPCVLQANNIVIGNCNNNNTGNTAADDKFDVTFVVNVVSGSTNFYNVTAGNQTFGPFQYGQTATITGLVANGQNITLIVTDAINSGCTTQFVVKQNPCSTCPQTASAGPDIQLTCAQNTATLSGTASATGGIFVWTGPGGFNKTGQTVTTSVEGTYTLTVTFPDQCVANDIVIVTKDANLPQANAGPDQELTCNKTSAVLTGSSNLSSNVTYTWTNAAGTVIGKTQSITVTSTGFYYLEVTNTQSNCKSGKDEVEVFNLNQQLTFNVKTWVCDNAGTTSVGNDDQYTITFNLSNSTNATNKYQILYQGAEIGRYDYNTNAVITVPADGSTRSYEFVDLVTGCKTNINAGPFNSCSTNCLITPSIPVVKCDDNGTESIDTDDTYTIQFSATALNASGSFIVNVDGQNKGTYTYGTNVTLTFTADGHTPFVLLTDINDQACQVVLALPALNPCSSKCAISAVASNILCNDNGTINDPSDDVFNFDIIVTGLNTSTGWKVVGSNTVHLYNERTGFGPYPISGGQVTLNLVDNQTANCTTAVTVLPPAVCSEPCVIAMQNLEVLACSNNNTNTITSDDYFSIKFKVNRTSGSATNYNVSDGTKTYGPFIYGELVTIDNLPATGNNIVLVVTDPSNSGCKTQFTVSKPPCSSCIQTADAGANQLITCQQNTVTLTGTATAGGNFRWTGPSGFDKSGTSVTTSTPGKYYLVVTYPDLCEAKDSVIVNKDANVPDAQGGPDKVLNCLISQVQIIGSTTATGTINLIWTDANGNQIGTGNAVSITQPGSYFFEVINSVNNCSSGKDEVVVTEDKAKPEATIIADPGNLLDCIIGTIVLSGKPVADVIFNWQTGESFFNNQPSITISKEGIVTMTAIDTLNGCENTAQIEIIDLQDYPILLTTPADPITCINNGVFISAGESPEGPNLLFTWLDGTNTVIAGQTNDSLYVTNPGTYYVMLTDTLNGCSNRDTFNVSRIGDFPSVKVSDDITLFCGKNTTSLTATILNPSSATSLVWNTNTGTILSPTSQTNINVQGAGLYQVKVVYPSSGCTTTESVEVKVNSNYPTSLTSAVTDETCKDEKDGSITINSITGGEPPITYKLNGKTVDGNAIIAPLAATSYQLEVTDGNGCKFSTNIVVKPGVDIQLLATSPIELVYNQSQIIELITNLKPDEIASIKWTPSDNLSCDTCLVTSLTAKTNITYKVEIVDIHGCSESVTITIRVRDNVIITAPNIIHPGSGTNKYFTIFGNESVINIEKLSIYDRWGNLVFLKENFKPNIPTEGWDGTFQGQDVVPGVFVYLVEYLSPSGVKNLAGDVTVIR